MIETLGIKKIHLIIAAGASGLLLVIVSTLLLSKSNSNPVSSVTQIERNLINEQTLKPEELNKLEKNSNEGKPIPEKVIQPEVSGTPKKETPAIGRPGSLPVQPSKQLRPRMATPQKQPLGRKDSSVLQPILEEDISQSSSPIPVQGQQESNSNNNPPTLTHGDTKLLLSMDAQSSRLRPRMDTPVLLRQGSSSVPPPPPLESGDSLIPPPPPEEDIDQSASEQGQQVGQSSSVVSKIPEAPLLPATCSNNNPSTLVRGNTIVIRKEVTKRRSKVAESDLSDLPTMSDDDSIKNNNDDAVSELKNSQSNDQIIGADVSNEIETKGSNNIMLNSETFLNVINQRNKGNGQSSQLGRGNSSSTLAAGDNNEDWETESDFVNNNTSNTGVGRYNVPGKSLLGRRRSSFSGFPVKCDATTYSQSNPPPLPSRQNQLSNTPPSVPPRGNKISNTSSLKHRRSSLSDLPTGVKGLKALFEKKAKQ